MPRTTWSGTAAAAAAMGAATAASGRHSPPGRLARSRRRSLPESSPRDLHPQSIRRRRCRRRGGHPRRTRTARRRQRCGAPEPAQSGATAKRPRGLRIQTGGRHLYRRAPSRRRPPSNPDRGRRGPSRRRARRRRMSTAMALTTQRTLPGARPRPPTPWQPTTPRSKSKTKQSVSHFGEGQKRPGRVLLREAFLAAALGRLSGDSNLPRWQRTTRHDEMGAANTRQRTRSLSRVRPVRG